MRQAVSALDLGLLVQDGGMEVPAIEHMGHQGPAVARKGGLDCKSYCRPQRTRG